MRRRLALLPGPLVAALAVASCVVVDWPVLRLRAIAGGMHNRRQVSGIRPFFLPDGRLGASANGVLLLEREPHGAWQPLSDEFAEIDDPDAAPDGSALVFTSGRDLVTAGGGHNDHVFQLYRFELASGEWQRLSTSRRAETLPRYTSDGTELVFVRRAEYDGWSLGAPWGNGSLFRMNADGTGEQRLTEGLLHPFAGLEWIDGDSRLVFGAKSTEGAPPRVLVLALSPGAAPEVLLENAYLPTPIPASDQLLFARVHAQGHGLARADLAGRVLTEYAFRVNEILGLAVSPDGARIAFSDFDEDGGSFGLYRLWELAPGAEEPRLRDTLPYRPEHGFKPLDVVKPPSWWFRTGASPGSR